MEFITNCSFLQAASRFQMRSLAAACYEKFRSDGMPEQEARRRLAYFV